MWFNLQHKGNPEKARCGNPVEVLWAYSKSKGQKLIQIFCRLSKEELVRVPAFGQACPSWGMWALNTHRVPHPGATGGCVTWHREPWGLPVHRSSWGYIFAKTTSSYCQVSTLESQSGCTSFMGLDSQSLKYWLPIGLIKSDYQKKTHLSNKSAPKNPILTFLYRWKE